MKREDISNAVGNISLHHIQEAEEYGHNCGKRKFSGKIFGKITAAAVLVLGLFLGGFHIFSGDGGTSAISVYARGMDQEISAAGVIVETGSISDSGSMKGQPLMFYLSGEDISEVRFSCRNQWIRFTDWTEKRDDYGQSRNFTVPFGEDESEYSYLLIEWTPNEMVRALTDNQEAAIASLPEEMREDIIVMEIAFQDGRTAVKAISISVEDDGRFLAAFDDYVIAAEDEFVFRPDSRYIVGEDGFKRWNGRVTEQALDRGEPQMEEYPKDMEAVRQAVLDYYEGTGHEGWPGFEVVKMGLASCTAEEAMFYVRVAERGIVQEPDRTIMLKLEDGEWKVTGEGY